MFVFCSRAQHGHIVLMALTVTVGVRSRILKLPELLKVPEEPDHQFYSTLSQGRLQFLSPGIVNSGS